MLEMDIILNQYIEKVQGNQGIVVLNQKLFRIHKDLRKKNMFYKLIGYAYQNGYLEMPIIKDSICPGFHYNFFVGEHPKQLKVVTEEAKAEYPYSLHFLDEESRLLFPIAADILPYNQDEPQRIQESLIAGGFFLLEICGLFQETFNQSIFAYGIRISKEGVLDNQCKQNSIYRGHENKMYKII
jgi:hypothetical protein